jgi:hypothetical protein
MSQKFSKAKFTSLLAYTLFQFVLFKLFRKVVIFTWLKDLESLLAHLGLDPAEEGICIKLGKWSLRSSTSTPDEISVSFTLVKIWSMWARLS